MPRAHRAITTADIERWDSCDKLVWDLAWKWAKITGYDKEDLHSHAKTQWFARWRDLYDPSKAKLTTYIYLACTRNFQRMANKWHRLIYMEPADLPEVHKHPQPALELKDTCTEATRDMVRFLTEYQSELFGGELRPRKLWQEAKTALQEIGWANHEIKQARIEVKTALGKHGGQL